MRDQLVPPGRFFSSASRTAVSAENRPVDTPQLNVDRSAVDVRRSQSLENVVDRSVFVPTIETIVNRLPGPKLFRQVPPRRTCAKNPENPIEYQAMVARWTPGLRRLRKQILNTFPLVIRDPIACHHRALRGCHVFVRRQCARIVRIRKEQFSDRA